MKDITYFYTFFAIIFSNFFFVKTVIITFFTDAYSDMFANFYANLKQFAIEDQIHAFVPKNTNLTFLIEKKVLFDIVDTEYFSREYESYGSKTWNRLNLIKGTIFPEVFKKYSEFLYSDPDVLWLKSALNYTKECCKKDICVQSDSIEKELKHEALNAGFFYAKKTDFSVKFFSEFALKCSSSDGSADDDQTILNSMIKTQNITNFIQIYDRDKFANGRFLNFFDDCKVLRSDSVITLHNNWIVGKPNKIKRAKLCGLWFLK